MHLILLPDQEDVFINYLPGAGELIKGPTLLGDVRAAGNLICASPPYLIRTTIEGELLVCVQRE